MTDDLSRYRLKDISELDPFIEKMGKEKFMRYGIKIYEAMYRIEWDKPFDVITNVKSSNLEIFIKVVCLFMHDYPGLIIFNDNYTKIYNVRFRRR